MFINTDQLNRAVELKHHPPQRIISLVPSQTELLFDLGLNKEVIGITKFCVHPESWFKSKTKIGGTKNLNIEKIKSLQPDLIIANKEENVKQQIELLEKIAPVWISDVNNLADALKMVESLGEITGTHEKSVSLSKLISSEFDKIKTIKVKLRTIYLIWRKPYMTVGGDTFIGDMLRKCGFENVFEQADRYPEIHSEYLPSFNSDLVLLSSEPFPYKAKHTAEIKTILPNAAVQLVTGKINGIIGS